MTSSGTTSGIRTMPVKATLPRNCRRAMAKAASSPISTAEAAAIRPTNRLTRSACSSCVSCVSCRYQSKVKPVHW